MQIPCPHCSANLDVTAEHFGQQVQCPACNGRFQVPKADEFEGNTTSRQPSRPEREGWEEQDHANVNFAKSLLIGLGATVLFMLLMVPFRGSRFGDIFLDRGWVNYVETFLFLWGGAILFLKWRKIQHQAQATLINLFPNHLGKEIHAGNVGDFIDNIYKTPLTLRDSLIVNRIRKALELFESRNDNGEISDFLGTQSDLDANRSGASYSLVKVFLWAIPILGFIGTVMGLSVAVGSLAMGDNTDPEALKNSINSLTGGLGVAFDTTLLGLILSILMSFPLAAVQKKEDETLTIIDTFCTEKLLPKLNDSKNPATDELLEQAESIPQLVSSLARAHETFLTNLNQATTMLAEAGETLQQRLDQHQAKVESDFETAITKLSDTSSDVFLRSHQNLERSFERMTNGIDQINTALRKLGEQQIPNEAKKKRGLFGR
ncbi:MAG: MotA/TolQ/ExbB proton channel family protein [Verrucomicrobiales bacterium]